MTQAYAATPTGNGERLPEAVINDLIRGLQRHPTTILFLAYIEERPAGIATCFLGFSTFTARQLLNVHDLAVLEEYRGQGISRALLEKVETTARELGCSRITLEVQEHNTRARKVYASAGFEGTNGGTYFCTKHL